MRRATRKKNPLRVRFLENDDDFRCAMLGSLGFSTRFIMAETRFSTGQVAYRLRVARIRRADYRNGRSSLSTIVLRHVGATSIPDVVEHLKTTIPPGNAMKQSEHHGNWSQSGFGV
jgi:hypothetical protein